MTDRLGNKLNVGDWILYSPIFVSFSISIPAELKVCQIKAIDRDRYGEICVAIDNRRFEYHLYGKTVEKLPIDKEQQEEYVFLKTLEFA